MHLPESIISALASRYTFGAEVGRGGMAVVYAAEDLRHGRPVAIKILSESAHGAERFLQEIRVAARLNHPHILPLFDSGEVDGRLFFVMPLVTGETLRARLRREGRLPIGDALRITREIGDALAYAHEAGVIHRDVKPENILLAHGHALLADFGIARATVAAGSGDALTQTGLVIGTLEYMSPEQLLGDKAIGPASDIYSLGCVLHEMLTGAAPHAGARAQAILAARLSTQAPSVRIQRPELSISAERSIGRALAADPADRFTSARDFTASLAGDGTSAAADPSRSLVVRPFDTVGEDAELAFFADGITEEVIGALSKVRELRVISRTSTMRLKGTALDVKGIGREYDVRYVVTGGVRRGGARVRVAAEIVDALLDAPVWTGRFDGTVEDPFDVQERVAAGIAEALQVSLSPDEQRRMVERPIADPRAYQCYRKAMNEIVGFTRTGLERAEVLLQEGLGIVGENARLFAGMGSVQFQYVNAGIDVSETRLAQAQQWLDRALALDPEQADAHMTLAWIRGSRGDMVTATRHLERMLAAEPNHSLGLAFSCVIAWITGRADHLEALLRHVQSIDPWELWGVVAAEAACSLRGDIKGRDRYRARAEEISPTPFVRFINGHLLAQDGEDRPARDLFSLHRDGALDDLGTVFCRAGLAAMDGNVAEIRALLARAEVRTLTALDAQWGWYAASIHSMAGDLDAGIAMLATAIGNGFTNVPLIESRDATLANLRGHARFPAVLAQAKQAYAEFSRAIAVGLRDSSSPTS